MATFHAHGGAYRVAVKGAPEAVLDAASRLLGRAGERPLDEETRRSWLEHNGRMAAQGLRVIALATKTVASENAPPYEDLVFVGLVGLLDPPRADVRTAIDACRTAGIRVVMVTGDQAGTARAIGEALGLLGDTDTAIVQAADLEALDASPAAARERILAAPIFARVSPEQKLELIAAYQNNGAVVAMTGDGVNDAPALKKADIGVAMGKRGTQVAAEAADMVLRDDAFSTIVAAVEQGRIIFDNIRKFVLYLLSCNVSEVLVVAVASLAQLPLPITPLQILFLNLVTDVFPALALGVGEGDSMIMRRPPRDPRGAILERRHWLAIAAYGLLITACVLAALLFALRLLDLPRPAAVTVSFLTLAFAQLWHVFNMRGRSTRLTRNDVVRNPYVWGALALCTGLLVAAVYVPPLARVLHIVPPDRRGWAVIAALSLLPLLIGQLVKIDPARVAHRQRLRRRDLRMERTQ
jgi:Ca2+-transporting ATPase